VLKTKHRTKSPIFRGQAQIGEDKLGNTQITEGGETLGATFFDYLPTSIDVTAAPGSVLGAMVTNLGIGMYNTAADIGNTALTQLTFGQYSLNLPNVPGGLSNAAVSGQALAMLLPAFVGDDEPTPGQSAQAEQTLLRYGPGKVAKAIRTLERRLAGHEADLAQYRATGGFTSATEREIRNFRQLIQAYRRVLGR
jgi:hypothetical protein